MDERASFHVYCRPNCQHSVGRARPGIKGGFTHVKSQRLGNLFSHSPQQSVGGSSPVPGEKTGAVPLCLTAAGELAALATEAGVTAGEKAKPADAAETADTGVGGRQYAAAWAGNDADDTSTSEPELRYTRELWYWAWTTALLVR